MSAPNGSPCQQPNCRGLIEDGYCDTCGMAAASAGNTGVGGSTTATTPLTSGGGTGGGSGTGSAPVSTRSAPVTGSIARSMRQSAAVDTSALGTAALGTARVGTSPNSVRTRRISARSDRSRLGVGLVTIPTASELDPLAAVIPNAQVAEDKRYCSSCNKPVGRGRTGQPGRVKGFCPACGAAFDFAPRLAHGTVLNAQYEVVGAIAHGGMGWIYLGRDRNLSGRFVVIKGLVNAADKDLQEAVITEKRFLAEVSHPLVVEVFNFVAHDGVNYIVMEYVGGTSLNELLKQRLKANNGVYSPLPLDQAIAFIVETLPAFTYLHNRGLLYCDFKPANLMQVGDGVKLIDLGGVRLIDDDQSALYGTVGFQAPEVPSRGASVASDLYTIARTLAVLTFEFRGYQNSYVDSLPVPNEVPLFAQQDSYYRFLLKATAPQPEDRFRSADEMREQLIGILREVVGTTQSASSKSVAQRTVPSPLFGTPGVEPDAGWKDLPALRPDPQDPAAAFLDSIAGEPASQQIAVIVAHNEQTSATAVALAQALILEGDTGRADQVIQQILANDPWEWRAVWLQGLAAMAAGSVANAIPAFNTVYGQIPGELAPKLALARACEIAGDPDVAAGLYEVCAQTDAAYSTVGLMGLARVATRKQDGEAALAALDRVPSSSRFFSWARTERARVLMARSGAASDNTSAVADLGRALAEHQSAGASPADHASFRVSALRQLVALAGRGPLPNVQGMPGSLLEAQQALDGALREQAKTAATYEDRVRLIDEANSVRPRTRF
jgi:serine/threonine-protein kinase PknG